MAFPLVSVILSVYKPERFLIEAINSVLEQSFTDFELIIIGDGYQLDKDERYNYFLNNKRVRYFSKFNSGLTDSLNFGISKSFGAYIARIDADDVWNVDKLKFQMEHISHFNYSLVGTSFHIIDEESKIKRLISLKSILPISTRFKFLGRTFPHSSALFKKSVFYEVGGYRDLFLRAQDRDLWIRFSKKSNISFIDKPLTFIREHSNQISSSPIQIFYSNIAKFDNFISIFNSTGIYSLDFFFFSNLYFPFSTIRKIRWAFFKFLVSQIFFLYHMLLKS